MLLPVNLGHQPYHKVSNCLNMVWNQVGLWYVVMWRVSLRISTYLTLKENTTQFKGHATEFHFQNQFQFQF